MRVIRDIGVLGILIMRVIRDIRVINDKRFLSTISVTGDCNV
jgi:hypothetical protein